MKRIILEKKNLSGNNRSHAMNSTRRKWKGNVQQAKMMINDEQVLVIGTARQIKSYRKQLLEKE